MKKIPHCITTLIWSSSTTNAYYKAPDNLWWDEFDKVICKVNGVAYTKGVNIPSCYSPISANLDPTSNVLNVEIAAEAVASLKTSRNLTVDPTFDIRLYDAKDNLVRQTSNRSTTTQFNVAGLSSGVYYLHVDNGVTEKPVVKQIVVQR